MMLEVGNYTEARATARVALAVDTGCVPALVVLARLQVIARDYDAALRTLGEAHQAHPEAAEPLLWLGNVAALQSRPDEARGYWREYVAQAPERPRPGCWPRASTPWPVNRSPAPGTT